MTNMNNRLKYSEQQSHESIQGKCASAVTQEIISFDMT